MDLDQCRNLLLEFVPILQCAPREKDVKDLAQARAGLVPIAQLRADVRHRIASGLVLTGYGIFAKLACDCIESAEVWAASAATVATTKLLPDNRSAPGRVRRTMDRAGPEFAGIAAGVRTLDVGGDLDRLNAILADVQACMVAPPG